MALAGALILILVVFPMLSLAREIPWHLWGHQPKVRLLTLVGGLLVGVPALWERCASRPKSISAGRAPGGTRTPSLLIRS